MKMFPEVKLRFINIAFIMKDGGMISPFFLRMSIIKAMSYSVAL